MVYILKITAERVWDHFLKTLQQWLPSNHVALATMLSSWWNVLLNRSGRGMVKDVVKVLDHIMKCWNVCWNVYQLSAGMCIS